MGNIRNIGNQPSLKKLMLSLENTPINICALRASQGIYGRGITSKIETDQNLCSQEILAIKYFLQGWIKICDNSGVYTVPAQILYA